MSAQDKVDRMAKAGYWLGGVHVSKDLCTCSSQVFEDQYGKVHNLSCPQWKATWVRRGSSKDMTNAR